MTDEKIFEKAKSLYSEYPEMAAFVAGAKWAIGISWKSIEEEKPDDMDAIVLVCKFGNDEYIHICKASRIDGIKNVTHWAYIPRVQKRRRPTNFRKDMPIEERREYHRARRISCGERTGNSFIKLNDEEIKQIISLYNSGRSRGYIERFFGVSKSAIRYQLKKNKDKLTRQL